MEIVPIDAEHAFRLERAAKVTGCDASAIAQAALDAYLPRLVARPKLTTRFTSGTPGLAEEAEEILRKGFGAHRM